MPGLQAQLGLSGPGLTTSATATSVGVPATLGSVAIDTTGNYTLTVAGLNGSTGGYTLQADLNAALSAATVGGARPATRDPPPRTSIRASSIWRARPNAARSGGACHVGGPRWLRLQRPTDLAAVRRYQSDRCLSDSECSGSRRGRRRLVCSDPCESGWLQFQVLQLDL